MEHGPPSGFKEMSLEEWVDTLPWGHGGRREFDELKARIESLDGQLSVAQGFHKVAIAERNHAHAKCDRLEEEHATMLAKIETLLEFKQYVHARLDMAGVPVDPQSTHGDAVGGDTRIAGRLDAVLDRAMKWLAHEATLPVPPSASVVALFPELAT